MFVNFSNVIILHTKGVIIPALFVIVVYYTFLFIDGVMFGIPTVPSLNVILPGVSWESFTASDCGRTPADLANKLTTLLFSKEELGNCNATHPRTKGIRLLDEKRMNAIRCKFLFTHWLKQITKYIYIACSIYVHSTYTIQISSRRTKFWLWHRWRGEAVDGIKAETNKLKVQTCSVVCVLGCLWHQSCAFVL